MKNATILLLILLCGYILRGQSLTVKQATSEHWASGACCDAGVNYGILLQAGAKINAFALDTLWIGPQTFLPGTAAGQVQCIFDTLAGTHGIYLGQSWGNHSYTIADSRTAQLKPPHYQGDALIACHINGRKEQLIIPKFAQIPSLPRP